MSDDPLPSLLLPPPSPSARAPHAAEDVAEAAAGDAADDDHEGARLPLHRRPAPVAPILPPSNVRQGADRGWAVGGGSQ